MQSGVRRRRIGVGHLPSSPLRDVLTMILRILFVPELALPSRMTVPKWLHDRCISYGRIGNDVFILINDARGGARAREVDGE